MTTTSSASRLSSQEQAQLIYQILSDVYDKSPWTKEQVVADLALDTTETCHKHPTKSDKSVGLALGYSV